MTDGERDAVRGVDEMNSGTESTHLSRIRSKEDRLREDARILRENRPELYETLREAFVEEEYDERVDRLEREFSELRERLEETDE
ncbi:hypothetical protein [Natrinema pallidum]|uniref:hypothetical protein n=1 Tax=Natrinema pallidum TaxID=69527 RepID=UPI001268A66D|nr:hypothetical protein [Natrinema pallidum]